MVFTEFGENRDPFSQPFKTRRQIWAKNAQKLIINRIRRGTGKRAGVENLGGTSWRVKKCAFEFW